MWKKRGRRVLLPLSKRRGVPLHPPLSLVRKTEATQTLVRRGQPRLLPLSWVEGGTAATRRKMKNQILGIVTGPMREVQSETDPKREGLVREKGQRT